MALGDINSNEDTLFQETHYARYAVGRTNIYGLTTLDSLLPTFLDRPEEFPSHRFTSLPEETQHSPIPLLKRPVRHLLTTSASEMTAFLSRDGYWNTLRINLALDIDKSEFIAMDAVESYLGGEEERPCVYVAVAVAECVEEEERTDGAANKFSLRIYRASHNFLEYTLLNIEDNCQIIPLASAPTHLSHILTKTNQVAFILPTVDGLVHMYKKNQDNNEFAEVDDVGEYFPMMSKINDQKIKILFMHFYERPNGERVICAGGQDGYVLLSFHNQDGREVGYHTTRVYSPITSVLVFQPRISKTVQKNDELHLIITCAIEQAIVYRGIEHSGLKKYQLLPCSEQHDSVLCSHVMDVDWDGQQEILIGTYGREVLIYKQDTRQFKYNLLWKRQFAYPIYRITHLDLNTDGLDELIVMTMYGVHILQANMQKARDRLLAVLQHVESNKRQVYELLLEWRQRREMEKAIVFEH